MTQAIAAKPNLSMDWATMKEQANILLKSRFLPSSITTPEQALAIALTGRELGIGFMESLRGIDVIQGKPTVAPRLMLALALRTKEIKLFSAEIVNGEAVVKVKRGDWPVHTSTFGRKEAEALGLIGKDNYKKQPETMFKWRAIAQALRVVFADVVSGMYTADEMGANVAYTEEGDVQSIDTTTVSEPTVPMPQAKQEPPAAPSDVTEADLKRLFKLAASLGIEQVGLKEMLKATIGKETTKDLTRDEFNRFFEAVKSAGEPPAAKAE